MRGRKYCCDGNTARMVKPLWLIERDGVKWQTAIYKCEVCGCITRRGETHAQRAKTCFVEIISEAEAQMYIAQAEEKQIQPV